MLVKSSVRQLILTTQASYTTYVIGARIPRGSVTRALYWDTDDPYHYFRVAEGASFKDGDQRHSQLEAWARERFPMIETIEFGWSGPVVEPVDGIAFIGRNPGDPRNVYIATGDSGMGMTHGTIAGILITDLIMKRQCAWVPLYDPSRKTLRASLRFAMESINIVAEFVEGYLPGGDVSSTEEIAHGEGAIIQRGMRKGLP